jgi:hypothetical protein
MSFPLIAARLTGAGRPGGVSNPPLIFANFDDGTHGAFGENAEEGQIGAFDYPVDPTGSGT